METFGRFRLATWEWFIMARNGNPEPNSFENDPVSFRPQFPVPATVVDDPMVNNLSMGNASIPDRQVPTGLESHQLGSQIGSYKLLRKLGEGGFGLVFLAEQISPVQRHVALKILKPGMNSEEIISRFQSERQALALMEHPHIARVFDAGTVEDQGDWGNEPTLLLESHFSWNQPVGPRRAGRPYFVMEWVDGLSITKYCDQLRLSVDERLRLFTTVCHAVQHAHQKGIIHRDLKPSNVLVASSDGVPIPKVIDFGLAKALNQCLTDSPLLTSFGQVVGTPAYMSPEQADGGCWDIDTRSDIYSLGVLLHELLLGCTPVDQSFARRMGMGQLARFLAEQEPLRPSVKLEKMHDLASAIATLRDTTPVQLVRRLRLDLDWIILKTLSRERERRYESVGALVAEIERHLRNEPIQARPPSIAYKLAKFLHRHRTAAAASLLVLVSMILGTAGAAWQAWRATEAEARAIDNSNKMRQQRDRAQLAEKLADDRKRDIEKERDRVREEKQIAQAVQDFLQNKLLNQAFVENQADTLLHLGKPLANAKYNPTVLELLNRAADELAPDKIATNFPNQPLVQAQLLQTVGKTYHKLGEYQRALTFIRRAQELRIPILGEDHQDTLLGLFQIALILTEMDDKSESLHITKEIRDRLQRLQRQDSELYWEATTNQALILHRMGRLHEALELQEAVLDYQRRTRQETNPTTLSAQYQLALILGDLGKIAESLKILNQVAQGRAKVFGENHPNTLLTYISLAASHSQNNNPAECVRLLEPRREKFVALYGPKHFYSLILNNNLALAYGSTGRLKESIALLEQIQPEFDRRLGVNHAYSITLLNNLAGSYWQDEKYSRAVEIFEQLLPRCRAAIGDDHPNTFLVAFNLAVNYRDVGRNEEALQLFDYWLPRAIATLEHDQYSLQLGYRMALVTYERLRRFDLAVPLRQRLVAVERARTPVNETALWTELVDLGHALMGARRFEEAAKVWRECLNHGQRQNPNSWDTYRWEALLGGALIRLTSEQPKHPSRAVLLAEGGALLRLSYDKMAKQAPKPNPTEKTHLAETIADLIAYFEATEQPEAAQQWKKSLQQIRAP